MSSAARSVGIFGLYMLVAGAVFVLLPPEQLRHAHVGAPFEPVRLLGILTLIVGGYYLGAARAELGAFFSMTVYGRSLAFALMAILVVVGASPPALLAVGVVDLAGAVWTYRALAAVGTA